jgi:hypothetical protein
MQCVIHLHNVQQAKMMSAVCAIQNQTFWMSLRQKAGSLEDAFEVCDFHWHTGS